jgi:hypothetical protein
MHGSFDKPGTTIKRIYQSWGIGVFGLPVLIVIALVGMAMSHLDTSGWISEAMQAEFVHAGTPDFAPARLAQPAREEHTAKAN